MYWNFNLQTHSIDPPCVLQHELQNLLALRLSGKAHLVPEESMI